MKERNWEDLILAATALLGILQAVRGARQARRDLHQLMVDGVNGSAWIAGMVSLSVERLRIVKRLMMFAVAVLLITNRQPGRVLWLLRLASVGQMLLDDWKSYVVARGRRAAEQVERRRRWEAKGGGGG